MIIVKGLNITMDQFMDDPVLCDLVMDACDVQDLTDEAWGLIVADYIDDGLL